MFIQLSENFRSSKMPSNKLSKSPSENELSNLDIDKPLLLDAEISPHNQDVLLHIASLIRLSEGFRLGFVKCNQPIQRRLLAARLKGMLAGEAKIFDVELTGSVKSLRIAVLEELKNNELSRAGKMAIMVYGFERSVPSEGLTPALEELNLSRELFSRDFPCPFLLWLPDYALTRLAREAPDFWGWRSGVFEFQPDLKLIGAVEKMTLQDAETASLSLSEKREQAAALEGLIRDYAELQRGERENLALAAVLCRLGSIRYQLGDYDEARRLYQESLNIAQDLVDKDKVSWSLHNLGILAQDTGNYDEARRLYQESLKIDRDLGDKSGVSRSLHNLGMLAQYTRNYDEARRLYQESLKIDQDLGDKSGIALSLDQLALLEEMQGNIKVALELTIQAEAIFKEIGENHHAEMARLLKERLKEKMD